jgi:pilus assembly protein FimV
MCAYWLAVGAALWQLSAVALGLGEIQVQSRLNQRFAAVIPLNAATQSQLDTLSVRVASAEDYARRGIDRADFLAGLRFEIDPSSSGARVLISSEQIAREPLINLLVDAQWQGSHMLREYSVLLDPPGFDDRGLTEAAATAPLAPPVAAPMTAPAAAPADVRAVAGTYGPVRPGETFWSIATRLRPGSDVTMDQVLLALYRANPRAFDHGRFNGLLKGSVLRVPDAEDLRAVPPEQAQAEIEGLRRGVMQAAVARRTAAAHPPAPNPNPGPSPAPAPAPIPAPVSASQAPPAESQREPQPAPVPAPPPEAPAAAAPAAAPPPAIPTAPSTPENAAPPRQPAPAPAAPVESPAAEPPKPAPAVVQPAPAETGLLDRLRLPLLIAMLALIIGMLVVRMLRNRRSGASTVSQRTGPAPKTPLLPPAAPEPSPAPVAAAPLVAAAAAVAAAGEEPAAQRKELPDDLHSTAILDAPVLQGAGAAAPQEVDFDLSSQLEAQTLSINLDANDPISEADFHLAYGLYDEAAPLLRQAAAREPERTDLRVKLAETYFAAGRPMEFQDTAEGLRARVLPEAWTKIAIMGRQLCPNTDLFQDSSGAAPSVDLALGEPGPAPAPDPVARAPAGSSAAATQDFQFDEPQAEPVAPLPAAGPPPAPGRIIDFDLDAELLNAAPNPAPTPSPAQEPVGEIDLSHFDLDAGSAPQMLPAGDPGLDFKLEEFDAGKTEAERAALDLGDEIGTKLDLARAYADMGDNEAARGLINEVLQAGSEAQKAEAGALRQRLSA